MSDTLQEAIAKQKNKDNTAIIIAMSQRIADAQKVIDEEIASVLSDMKERLKKEGQLLIESLQSSMMEEWNEKGPSFKGDPGDPGKPGDNGRTPTEKEIVAMIRPLIPKVRNGVDGKTPTAAQITPLIKSLMPVAKDGSPDSPTQIVEKLQSLRGSKRLDSTAIKGLENLFADIQKQIKSVPKTTARQFGKVGGGGDSLLLCNLSASLNGSTKTFPMPAHRKILGFFQSSAPFGAFVENTDFTHTRTSITFTSQVDASTALASGQAFLVLYSR